MRYSIAWASLLLFAVMAVGLIVASAKTGWRGRALLLTCIFAGLAAAVGAVFVARVESRDRFVNTYPTLPGQASGVSTQLVDDVHRSVAEIQEDVARQQAELHDRIAQQQAELHDSLPEWELPNFPADARTVIPYEAPMSEPWKSAAELGFDADVHPSAAAAAESLVIQVLKLKDASHPDVVLKRVQIWGGEHIDGEVISRAVARLQQSCPQWEVMVEAAEPVEPIERADAEAASIRLEVPTRTTTQQAPWDYSRSQIGGILRLRMTWQGGSIDRSTNFTNKPWVENASQFISEKPEMRWVVGYSSPDANDATEAKRQALQAAAVQMIPEIKATLQRNSSGNLGLDDRWLLSKTIQHLSGMRDVRDHFTQTLITPYGGQVARQAILVQSPALVQRVVCDCFRGLKTQRKTWITMIASAAGMLILVCVVGLLLNNVTKGYYRGRIMAVTGLLAIVGLMLFLKLLSMHNSGYLEGPLASSPMYNEDGEYRYVYLGGGGRSELPSKNSSGEYRYVEFGAHAQPGNE